MSVPNSIFQQLCPACATSIPINSTRCECGHDLGGQGSPLETTLRDEELYESYLAARAEQAQESVQAAARALTEDQGNDDLASALTLSKEVAASIEEDLAQQRDKIQKLREMIPPPTLVAMASPTDTTRTVSTPVQATPKKKVETRIEKLDVSAPPTEIGTQPISETPALSDFESKSDIPDRSPVFLNNAASLASTANSTERASPVMLTTPSSMLHKASTALSALKQAKAREGAQQLAALRAQIARQKKIDQEKAEQEAAAEALAHSSFTPPTAFRDEQAARAERAMQDHILNSKECPNCTSRLSLNVTRCQCGYAFPNGSTELPTLTLCTGDFTALRNTFLADLRNRR